MQLALRVYAASQRGRRGRDNQDFMGWYFPRDASTAQNKGALLVIADGMGGHVAGAVASRVAVRTAIRAYYSDGSSHPSQSLQRAMELADQWVWYWGSRREDLRDMGTTLTAVAVWNGQLVVGHIGDSRAYLTRQYQAWPLTRDHTWIAEAVAHRVLTPAEARGHPWQHVLTRCVGKGNTQADVRRVVFSPGDRLALMTDGISSHIWEHEIAHVIARSPQAAANRLSNMARKRGSADDRTVLVVELGRPVYQPRSVVEPVWQQVLASVAFSPVRN